MRPFDPKLPAGLRFLSPGQAETSHPPSIQTQRGNKNTPLLYVHSSLNFLDGLGAALRGLTTGTRWPCNACVPLLYCVYGNVIATDCLKSLTTSEQYQSDQSLLIAPSWWAAAHSQRGEQTSAFTLDTLRILKRVVERVYRSRTQPTIRKNRKNKNVLFKEEKW